MIKFKKMHGNGNDFIILENLTTNQKLSRSQLIKMGDRHKGLGFDQLITINPPNDSNHDFYIRFFNSDGSEADMCMNGVRSVGAFLWKAELAPNRPLLLGTKSKPICIKPINSKKVKVVLDHPREMEISKSVAEFLKKNNITKYRLVNAGNIHLLIESKKIFAYQLDELSKKLDPKSQVALKETLGHTKIEVIVGSLLGPLITLPGIVFIGSPLNIIDLIIN